MLNKDIALGLEEKHNRPDIIITSKFYSFP